MLNGSVVRIAGDRAVRFTEAEGLPPGGVCSLTSDAQGQLWFAKGGQVGRFHQGRFVTMLTLGERYIAVQNAGRKPDLDLCRRQTAELRTWPAAVEVGRIPAGAALVRPTALFEDRAGGLWIGTSASGLFHYDGTNIAELNFARQDQDDNRGS